MDHGYDRQGDNEGDEDQNQNPTQNQVAASKNAPDTPITALASVAAFVMIMCFEWLCLNIMMVLVSFCPWKHRGGREDEDVIRATVCGTLASVICVSHSVGDADGETRSTSQPCTPRSSSVGKPNPDKAAGGLGDDGNIITPSVFRHILRAVVATSPPSHSCSECCHTECTADFCSERRGSELPQVVVSPVGNVEEEEQKRIDVENAAGVDCQQSGLVIFSSRGAGERGGEAEASNPAERSTMSWVLSSFRWPDRRDGPARQASTAPGGRETTASSSGIRRAGASRTSERTTQREVRSPAEIFWDRIESRGECGVGPPLASTAHSAEATERLEGESREGLGALSCETAPPPNRTMICSSFHSSGGATALDSSKPKDDIVARSCRSVVNMKKEAARSHGEEDAVSSPVLPRAKVMRRAYSEVDHARVKENHRRTTQRHLAVFNIIPAVENPHTCYTPSDA